MTYELIAFVPVLLPVIIGLLLFPLQRVAEQLQRLFIIAGMGLCLAVNLGYLIGLIHRVVPVASLGPIYLDAPGMFIATLVTFIGMMVLCYSFVYRAQNNFDCTFFSLYFILAGMMCGMACTYNVLVMLVFLEAATVTSAVLILFGRTRRAIRATYIYLGISIVEVILVVYASFILYNTTGTLDLRMMDLGLFSQNDLFILTLLFLFGFGTKAGLLPLSAIWLPPAHADGPAAISATMSGILIKASIIAMVKLMYPFYFLDAAGTLVPIILALATLNMVLGGVMALLSENIKRLLAWSSVSQMGYIFIGLGVATPIAIYGSLFHILNHMLFKGSLFLISGILLYHLKTLKLHEMGGLLRRMPVTAACFLVASLAMAGLPFLNGFISKEIIYEGTVEAGFPVLLSIFGLHLTIFGILGWVTSIIILICLMRAFVLIFLGEATGRAADLREAPLCMILPVAIMVGCCVLIGLFPDLVTPSLRYIADMLYAMR